MISINHIIYKTIFLTYNISKDIPFYFIYHITSHCIPFPLFPNIPLAHYIPLYSIPFLYSQFTILYIKQYLLYQYSTYTVFLSYIQYFPTLYPIVYFQMISIFPLIYKTVFHITIFPTLYIKQYYISPYTLFLMIILFPSISNIPFLYIKQYII